MDIKHISFKNWWKELTTKQILIFNTVLIAIMAVMLIAQASLPEIKYSFRWVGIIVLLVCCSTLGSAIVYGIDKKLENNTKMLDDAYNYISAMQREAYDLLYKGQLNKEEILTRVREIRFNFLEIAPWNKQAQRDIDFAKTVRENDMLMYKYVIVRAFNNDSYKELKKEVKKFQTVSKEKQDIIVSLNKILIDRSSENLEKVEKLLAEWTTRPFISLQISQENFVSGKNCAIIYYALLYAGIIYKDTSPQDYLDCLSALKVCHEQMEIVTSGGSMYYYNDKIHVNDPTIIGLKEIISKELLGR